MGRGDGDGGDGGVEGGWGAVEERRWVKGEEEWGGVEGGGVELRGIVGLERRA